MASWHLLRISLEREVPHQAQLTKSARCWGAGTCNSLVVVTSSAIESPHRTLSCQQLPIEAVRLRKTQPLQPRSDKQLRNITQLYVFDV